MLPLNLLGSRWSLAQASLNKDGASLHSMLTSDSRAFSWTVQLLTPAGRPPGGWSWTAAERMPQDSRCEGQCGAGTELASRRRKPLLGQKSRPLQRSDVLED